MKYSIGYQLPDEFSSTPEICSDYSRHISDVFFAWGNEPSGRFPLGHDYELERITEQQLLELSEIKKLGKRLTLLLNANCYGEAAASTGIRDHVISLCSMLLEKLSIDAVTVASPFVAQVLKENFGSTLKIKASVNMRIGSVKAMRQLSDAFDGFYIKKELNRNFRAIEELKSWCDANGKELYMLANSGCITDCAFQTFHDNLIAHQKYGGFYDSVDLGHPAPCHKFIKSLGLTNGLCEFMGAGWVRPEQIYLYEKYFDEIKLATRMHSRPQMVVAAYCRGKFKGNLLDLTEPSFSSVFSGYILDNTKIDNELFERVLGCNHRCESCNACESIVRACLTKIDF
jgi:hypothetical protein